ncbi:unnamed protein product [Caenorhabditis angaria]|uniref:mRNA-decapping enzyme C-terminal domain-containing protein n=1 Tax=Caenorhabditis angaria TaxID=860376 RepID=A0A9P1N2S9_9PELO|nr:unnamed protein product [Caenorhabditis angaria]
MESKKKITPAAAELAAKNLAQIQKIDPCASQILDKVPHAALYKFNKEKNAWEKTDIDGTMFVYQRVDRPFFSLMIANRQSPQDYIEPITSTLKINNDEQYIFFCKQDGTINGLWCYDPRDTSRIYKLVERLITKINKETKQASATSSSASVPGPTSSAPTDSRSAQLLDLIRGGKHNDIKQTPEKHLDTPTSSTQKSPTKPQEVMPVLLQKLMIQEQPKSALKEPGTAIPSDELEKDLLKTAKPRGNLLQDFVSSPSAVSLAAISTKSVHGSEGEEEAGSEAEVVEREPGFVVGSGASTPVLNKQQFLLAISHLFQTDDQFVAQVHQAYIDALNRRLRID